MELLVVINMDKETHKDSGLVLNALAKICPETLQVCLHVTGMGPTQLSRAGVRANTFLVSAHFSCLVPINTVGFQALMDTLWRQEKATRGCRLPTRLRTNETFTVQTL
ncbi:hypothetical protein HispidOSU_023946, partial [Sigmodon hispidus]